MKKDEDHVRNEENAKCKRCGRELYNPDSKNAGYCQDCANKDKYARKAWEDRGLAKFCSVCRLMLHDKESIETGKCIVCRIGGGIMDRKDRRLIRGIIVTNVIVVMISIFLWVRYVSYVGILIVTISILSSFVAIRIMANKYGVCEYRFTNNCLVDKAIKKLVKW